MPKQKASSFAEDLATVQSSSFADDLAAASAPAPDARKPSMYDAARTALGSVNFSPIPGNVGHAFSRHVTDSLVGAAQDPAALIPTGSAQGGAMAGARLGSMLGPWGAVGGGVLGAAIGGATGKVAQNKIKARPANEGVASEAALQGGIQGLPVVGKGMLKAGKFVYKKALSPVASDLAKMAESSHMLPQEVADTLVDTGIRERLVTSPGGIVKADRIGTGLESVKRAKIDESGASVDPHAILSDARKWLNSKFGPKSQNIPQSDMAAVESGLAGFENNPSLRKPYYAKEPDLRLTADKWPVQQQGTALSHRAPASDINRMREGSQKNVRDKWGRGIKDANTETEKALIHAESNATKAAVPEVAPIMQRQHELLNWSKAAERKVTNASNANLVRLYEFLGALEGNPLKVALGSMLRPGILSKIGLNTHDTGRLLSSVPPEYVRSALADMLAQSASQREK